MICATNESLFGAKKQRLVRTFFEEHMFFFVACVPSNNFGFVFFLLRHVSKLFTMWKVFKKCKKTNSKNFPYTAVCETLTWRAPSVKPTKNTKHVLSKEGCKRLTTVEIISELKVPPKMHLNFRQMWCDFDMLFLTCGY